MSKYEPLWDWAGKQVAKDFTQTFALILTRETITAKLNTTGDAQPVESAEMIMDAAGLR